MAEALGVSKWTSYDILKELEKEGYLHSEYSVSREERYAGRSILLFLPSPKARELFLREKKEKEEVDEEWPVVREELLEIFGNVKRRGSIKVIDDLLEEMPPAGAPIIVSAYIIAALIVYIQNLGTKAVKMMKSLLKPAQPELALGLFAGTALGAMAKNMHEVINRRLVGEVGRLQKYISEFSARENKLLAKFLGDALERAR